jgi:MFS family permease
MVLGAVQAVINAFDMPARQSFLGQMIEDRADLPNAIALNSSMVNGARLLGPLFAAELVAFFGEGWCFAIDALSYVAVIASLLLMTVPVPRMICSQDAGNERPLSSVVSQVWAANWSRHFCAMSPSKMTLPMSTEACALASM